MSFPRLRFALPRFAPVRPALDRRATDLRALVGPDLGQAFVRRALLALCLLAALPSLRAQIKVGDTFPALDAGSLVGLSGGALPATAGKVVLVDFWASWCAPCKASFPALAKLHQELSARGVVVLGVSIDEKPAAAAAFIKRLSPPFVTVHDRDQKLVKQVVVPTMPTSYLVGRDGKVRFVHEGYHGDATDRLLRQHLEALLAETK
jgi:thiol-disulfide isomerase/thioredoxin